MVCNFRSIAVRKTPRAPLLVQPSLLAKGDSETLLSSTEGTFHLRQASRSWAYTQPMIRYVRKSIYAWWAEYTRQAG